MSDISIIVIIFAVFAVTVALILLQIQKVRSDIFTELRITRQETSTMVQSTIKGMSDILSDNQRQATEMQSIRLSEMTKQFFDFSIQNEQKLDNMRTTIDTSLKSMQESNGLKLDEMRATVDEKLQKTLEERISKSFQLVSERLEQVYKGLGEMQNLAIGVGELKKVLSNVKTRGVLGEIQLGAILEQILSPEQYETNFAVRKNSQERVEFAIKLPGDENGFVYLPIDAKFPADAYALVVDAYEKGNSKEIEYASKELDRRIKLFAKDIKEKYIAPPLTTDFAIMFLPVEGLYAEVVRKGLIETLQNDYKINVAGPTTMAALLNSLQMGFKTLAIQKRSGEVWDVLGSVKVEFDKFGVVLEATQRKLEQATEDLDKLVGVRTRQIQNKLRNVSSISEPEPQVEDPTAQ